MQADRTPVIVGIGETADPRDASSPRDPLALAAAGVLAAAEDAGPGRALLDAVDSIEMMAITSWRYAAPAAALARRLGLSVPRLHDAPISGDAPLRAIARAADRIAEGRSAVAIICGAEAQASVDGARRAGISLDWPEPPIELPRQLRAADHSHPVAVALGAAIPATVYPFYETANAAAFGQTPAEARAESAALWSAMSAVAAGHPLGWAQRRYSSAEIQTPDAANRMICWPYTKLQVANPSVNLGTAVIVTSLAAARRAGVAADRIVAIEAGFGASEPDDYLARGGYATPPAQTAVLEAARRVGPADLVELYSCFPCVPKAARRTLGLAEDAATTLAGGLTFFGAPLSNYMTHAVAAAVRRLRAGGSRALVYGQGGFATKHYALTLAHESGGWAAVDLQPDADRRRGPVPAISVDARGAATLEAVSIPFDRNGGPVHGIAILRLADGGRSIARVPANDERTLARLMDERASPIGLGGDLRRGERSGEWRCA